MIMRTIERLRSIGFQWHVSIGPLFVCPACSIPLYRSHDLQHVTVSSVSRDAFPGSVQRVVAYGTGSGVAELVLERLGRLELRRLKHPPDTI